MRVEQLDNGWWAVIEGHGKALAVRPTESEAIKAMQEFIRNRLG